jgi:carboxymethylenebutenolidase
VNLHEAGLQRHGKEYEFYRYDDAGHGFFYYHPPMYRFQAAMDGWAKGFSFFSRHLKS